MKVSASHKRRLFLTKNLIMMLVVLAVIVLAVSAWFTSRTTATADGINIRSAVGGIDIAPCIKTYNADGTVKTDGPGEFTSGIHFDCPTDFGTMIKDCTGNGETLIIPEFNVTKDYESVRKHGGKEVNENLAATNAKSNIDVANEVRQNPGSEPGEYQFLEFEFYVRSSEKNLFLSPQTRVVAETEVNGQALSSVPSGKKSEYGENLNVDGLVGAIRVSLLGEACTAVGQTWENNTFVTEGANAPTSARLAREKQLLWLPRPDVFLNISPAEGDISTWTLSTGVLSGESYNVSYYLPGNGNSVVKTANDSNAVVSSGTTAEGNLQVRSLGSKTNISNYSYSNQWQTTSLRISGGNDATENYYVTKYTLRVWIEGCDVEARRAMDGGKFSVKLFFE